MYVFHVPVVKDDSVSQLTAFDLRNISDKYLLENRYLQTIDLMNHHSLDKTSFLEVSHSWTSLNRST